MQKIMMIAAIAAILIGCSDSKEPVNPEPTPTPTPTPEPVAEWKTSDTTPVVLSTNAEDTQIKTVMTSDGKIVMTWLRPEGGDLESSTFGYRLYLQLFNTDGTPAFGTNGILISDKPTMTYTTDYALSLAPNGDILMAYWDTRNDQINKEYNEVFLYRYSQEGNPVWAKDGVRFSTGKSDNIENVYEVSPTLCVSGNNIYVGIYRIETGESYFYIQRLDEKGSPVWESSVKLKTLEATFSACPGGDIYVVYGNETFGLDAIRLDASGNNVWGRTVTVESSSLSGGIYMPKPNISIDGDQGMFLSYRILQQASGYQVFNYLSSSGNALNSPISCNGNTDGDAGLAVMGSHNGRSLVVWELTEGPNDKKLMVNLFDRSGNPLWDNSISLAENELWGFAPVAIIPQSDGWIVLYGDCTNWNIAIFNAQKIDNDGKTVWIRQLGQEDFVSTGFSVQYDGSKTYIFYTYEDENSGMGGMNVLCISNNPI